jgi:hypothetical protein
VGATVAYDVDVESLVVTHLDGPPEESAEHVRLRAVQRVRGSDAEGQIALELTLSGEGDRPRTFDVALDAHRGVATLRSVEGLPVEVLGELGPSRLVVLATGLLPGRDLHAGQEWNIARTLELPEGTEHLTGRGRLEALRVDHGVALARVEAHTRLPVRRDLRTPEGRVLVEGTESTAATVDYVVNDGTVRSARSVTTGTFSLSVSGPGGIAMVPLRGSLDLRIESTTVQADVEL